MIRTVDPVIKKHLAKILAQLQDAGVKEQSTVILVGSLARGMRTWRSDADFLVVTPVPIRRWRVPVDMHLHLATREAFYKKLDEGNDFEAWAVRFGRVCADSSGWWLSVQSDGKGRRWPDWRLKVKHARKRQSIAEAMLAQGDHAAAEEEYLMAAAHVSRALLLRSHAFPLSRPEMPAQLAEIGMTDDARVLAQLIRGTRGLDELRALVIHVDRRVDWLESLARNERTEQTLTSSR